MKPWLAGLVALCGALASCGYVGEPLPPALNIASPVTDFRAVQRGDRIIVDFTIPPLTTEGLVLTGPGTVDLRVGVAGAPFSQDAWASSATRVEAAATDVGPVEAAIPVAGWVSKDVVIGVRLINRKGRASGWSNLVSINVVSPVVTPLKLAAESAPEGARLTWQSTAKAFRVFRRAGGEKEFGLLANAAAPPFVDSTAQFGTEYEYRVQAVREQAESELSAPVAVTPRDTFAPTVPAGLSAVAGLNSVELVWERNTEADLKGYRIYRAPVDGTLQVAADFVDAPAYSDRQVESGKRYRYAISAMDQAGNESAKTAPVEITAP